MNDSDRLSTLTAAIAHDDQLISRVLRLIRTVTIHTHPAKTLRFALERAIRAEFGFDLLHCSHCDQFFTPGNFGIDRSRPNGRRGICTGCHKVRRQDLYWEDPEHARSVKRALLTKTRGTTPRIPILTRGPIRKSKPNRITKKRRQRA